jgi:hypothetical protein
MTLGICAITQQAEERGHRHDGRRAPDGDLKAGFGETGEQCASDLGGEVEPQPAAFCGGKLMETVAGVALEQLSERMQRRFGDVVTGGKAVGAGGEIASAGKRRQGPVGLHQLKGDEPHHAACEVLGFDPGDAAVGWDLTETHRRDGRKIGKPPACSFTIAKAGKHQGPVDALGVPSLHRFHGR